MPLPTLQKTWQIVPNLYVPATTTLTSGRKLIYGIKEALTGFASGAMTVAGSSDSTPGAGMDAVDRWTDWSTDIVWDSDGNPHSWIVLERVDGIQICFDLDNTMASNAHFYASPSGSFTGGSNLTRPTASDEFGGFQFGKHSTGSSTVWRGFYNDYDATVHYHVWNSTDGLIQRVVGFSRANTVFFWRFELVQDAPTGFSPPFIASVVFQNSSSYPESLMSGDFLNIWGFGAQYKKGAFRANGINSKLYNTALRGAWPRASWAQVAEEIDNVFSLTDIVYFSRTDGTKGFKGRSYDLWVTCDAPFKNGDSFPDDPDDRQFVCAGSVVLPWTGDSTIMLV